MSQWSIQSRQIQLISFINASNHNYIALVNPQRIIEDEIHFGTGRWNGSIGFPLGMAGRPDSFLGFQAQEGSRSTVIASGTWEQMITCSAFPRRVMIVRCGPQRMNWAINSQISILVIELLSTIVTPPGQQYYSDGGYLLTR